MHTGVVWVCVGCGGRLASIGLLRSVSADLPTLEEYWKKARRRKPAERQILACPMCAGTMKEVSIAPEMPVVDVCNRCQVFWFDPGEYELVPKTEPRTFESREAMLHRVQREQQLAPYPMTMTAWHVLALVLGLPVEEMATRVRRPPWITRWTAGTICLLSLISFTDFDEIIKVFAFVPAEPWRLDGITWLTASILHGSSWHLFSNLYFLLTFGDNVEDFLGPWRFAALLLLAVVCGDAFHTLVDIHSTVPCIGASGGISGVLAFYALRFPHARVRFRFGYAATKAMSAWAAFLMWLGLQGIGLAAQSQGLSSVSAAAHLGGVLVGASFWMVEEAYNRYGRPVRIGGRLLSKKSRGL